MSKKALIVYGARYGATESTSEEITKLLRSAATDPKRINARKIQVRDVTGHDLLLVGSGMQVAKWTGAAEVFLKKFQK